MAASAESGILFNKLGIAMTQTNKNTPWSMAENLDFAPELTFALLRTMTLVTGKPPIKPASILPKPCDKSSRLVFVTFRSGSRLSTASMLKSVSKDAIMAIIKPVTMTLLFKKPLKSGNVKKLKNSEGLFAAFIFTKWSSKTVNSLPVAFSISFKTTATITATKAPGTNLNRFLINGFSGWIT